MKKNVTSIMLSQLQQNMLTLDWLSTRWTKWQHVSSHLLQHVARVLRSSSKYWCQEHNYWR